MKLNGLLRVTSHYSPQAIHNNNNSGAKNVKTSKKIGTRAPDCLSLFFFRVMCGKVFTFRYSTPACVHDGVKRVKNTSPGRYGSVLPYAALRSTSSNLSQVKSRQKR